MKSYLVLLILSMCLVRTAASENRVIRPIATPEAARMVTGSKAVYVDAREPFEVKSGTAPGAINVPYLTIQRYPEKLPSFLKKLPKTSSLIVFCSNGARARPLAELLFERGFDVFLLR